MNYAFLLGIFPESESSDLSAMDASNDNNAFPVSTAATTADANGMSKQNNGTDDEEVSKRCIACADWSMSAKNPATFSTKKELQTVVELS